MKISKDDLLMYIFGVPMLGLALGGIYWIPISVWIRGREPWSTLLFAAALALTIFGVGHFTGLTIPTCSILWALATLFLLIARAFGPLHENIERFGQIHLLILMIVAFALPVFESVRKKARFQEVRELAPTEVR